MTHLIHSCSWVCLHFSKGCSFIYTASSIHVVFLRRVQLHLYTLYFSEGCNFIYTRCIFQKSTASSIQLHLHRLYFSEGCSFIYTRETIVHGDIWLYFLATSCPDTFSKQFISKLIKFEKEQAI